MEQLVQDPDFPANRETRVVSATGGAKGSKEEQLGTNLDPLALLVLSRVGTMGARKYKPWNYMSGFDWSLSYNALQRHVNLYWAGEETDDESGISHMGHAAWQALCLISFDLRTLGTDDRPPKDPEAIRRIKEWRAPDPG